MYGSILYKEESECVVLELTNTLHLEINTVQSFCLSLFNKASPPAHPCHQSIGEPGEGRMLSILKKYATVISRNGAVSIGTYPFERWLLYNNVSSESGVHICRQYWTLLARHTHKKHYSSLICFHFVALLFDGAKNRWNALKERKEAKEDKKERDRKKIPCIKAAQPANTFSFTVSLCRGSSSCTRATRQFQQSS